MKSINQLPHTRVRLNSPAFGRRTRSAGLALALFALVAANLGRAQTAQDYIVSQFDDGTVQGWAYNYGGATCTLTNSPDMNRGPLGAGAGALNVTAPFNLCTLGGNNQTDWEKVFASPIDLTKFTKLHFSVYVDTNSAHLSDWGAGALGNIRPHIRLPSWGGDVSLAVNSADSQWVGSDYGNWHDYSMTIDQTGAGKLATLQTCGILGFQIWSGWGSCAAPIGLTNTISFWIDNIWFETNLNPIIPPPVMGLKKAGVPGVTIALDPTGGQWDRQAISTPSPDGSYIWTAQGGYPVSYSCTITDFPPVNTHYGYEAHMYIVNGDTAGSGNNVNGATDWNSPDIFIFRIENVRNTSYTTNGTVITTNYTYNAMAQIQWKTNYPGANATNIPVVVFPPSVPGTWTVTFTDATHGSLSGPGITATNFTLPDDAVANNFSPATSYVQFGNFRNDGANDGHNNDAKGTFSHVKISGVSAPIDDDFSGATLTNKYAWRKTAANEVLYVAPGTLWDLTWSVPAYGYNPNVASSILGPWTPMTLPNQYQSGTNIHAALMASDLPAGGSAYFKMVKHPFTKLQVLLPGETAAPGTPTGKTGTPDPQTGGVPFNITVNAVDNNWNPTAASDTVAITSTDPSFLPPANAALVGGTQTFSVTLVSSGSWTITASDVTDNTKTAGTSSTVTVP